MNSAFAGCLDGWVYAQMLITTTGNTGRRITIPLKPKSKHRFRKYIIRTMELTAIGVWKLKVILTVIPPFINIWIQSLVSVRLSVSKSLNMSIENRIRYSIISLSRISQQMKSIDNAPMERYFNTLKNECTNLYEFTTEETLYQKVEEFAYVDYNHVRPHSYNGYRTTYEARTAA